MVWVAIGLVVVAAAAALGVWAARQRFTVETAIDIDAPAHQVWKVLLDFPSYGEWNPLITEISGVPAEGERLDVAVNESNGTTTRFRPLVLRVSPARQLRLLRRLGPLPLLDGDHSLVLRPDGDATRFEHGIVISGMLTPFVRAALERDTEKEFTAMNEALAERVRVVGGGNA
jgi:hypothetical protein